MTAIPEQCRCVIGNRSKAVHVETATVPAAPIWIGVRCPSCQAPPGRPCDTRFVKAHAARERSAHNELRRCGMLTLWCPVCSRDAVLIAKIDRFLHLDGTENRTCWAAISGGDDW
jgi:hypothetical protein